MLFNSIEFLFLFLPITFVVVWMARRWAGASAALALLTIASVVFYSVLKPWNLPVLLGSVAFNWVMARGIDRSRDRVGVMRRWLMLGILGNLGLLFWFKYSVFVATQVGLVGEGAPGGVRAALERVLPTALPLGISFYTFQQIAYLVDLSKGACERAPFPRHQLLVSFFPHHIAGPITHPRSFLPQLRDVRFDWSMIALGLFILGLGLAKKVALADPLGRFVDPAFANPAALSGANAWAAVVAYTLQLYLDFSGYSDMAVGLGLMFGMRLPWNFDSPYKAASIAAFWRRWHITLSDFLRQYVYVPLGGSRSGKSRTLVNLLLTMLIGGIWHGAGWTFVLWGALHGMALAINHAWRWREAPLFGPGPRRALGWALTMLVVMFGWVLFRSNTLQDAWTITKRMAGVGGPHTYWPHPALASVVPMMVVSLGVVWLTPNVREWSERFRSTWPWLLFGAMAWALAMVRILSNMKPPEFLYFDF